MKKAVIFDFDGTLTELTLDFDLLREETEEIARKYGAGKDLSGVKDHYIVEMIYKVEGLLGPAGAGFREEAFARLRDMELEASLGKDLYPFTREVLSGLKAGGVRIGIITRSCIEVLRAVFPDMENFVDAVVTREDTQRPKPHPDHVREALKRLNVDASEAIVVGDHPTDIMAGRALGMETAGVLTGRTKREAFEKEGATHVLSDVRGLLELDNLKPPTPRPLTQAHRIL
jgi:phosphoglycolate phosphatase